MPVFLQRWTDKNTKTWGIPPMWGVHEGQGPILATAIHNGHRLRPDLLEITALSATDRLREEDPFTAAWTQIAPNRLWAMHSRYQVDVNRPRARAIYMTPQEAWGKKPWQRMPNCQSIATSLAEYDRFYQRVEGWIEQLLQQWPHVVVLDLHTYNHRRAGADGPPAHSATHPEIIVGTMTMVDRRRFAPVIEGFISRLHHFFALDNAFNVQENVLFCGGEFAAWLHQRFAHRVCVLSIEVKKIFMDEWRGRLDYPCYQKIYTALHWAAAGIVTDLQAIAPLAASHDYGIQRANQPEGLAGTAYALSCQALTFSGGTRENTHHGLTPTDGPQPQPARKG